MPTRLLCALALVTLGCSSGESGGGGSGTGGGGNRSPEYVGAWDAHDSPVSTFDIFCVLLCDNGRAFTEQYACSDTTQFYQYKTWSNEGTSITLQEQNDPPVTFVVKELSGDEGTFVVDKVEVPFTRTAPTSSLCTSTDVSPD